MTGIQAGGIGSGLDINSLVSQLVAAERAPLDARITRRESALTVEISALARLKSSMSSLRDALAGLRTSSAMLLRTATSPRDDVFTASAGEAVPPGNYDIEVVRTATVQRLATAPFPDGRNAVVGTGTLTIAYGNTTFDIAVDGTNNTLAGIRDAINAASANAGVSASIVNEDGGSRLVLAARSTGIANAVKVTQSGGDGGLAKIVHDPAAPASNTMIESPATDALVRVNGYDYTSASNTVTGAVEGLTLTLRKADAGTLHSLTVADDTAQVTSKIRKFISDYNGLCRTFASLQSYDASTRKAGALLGDAYVRGMDGQLRRDLSGPVESVTGPYGSIASIGIRTDATGQLTLDEPRLIAALKADFAGVAAMFTASDGVAVRLHARLDAALKTDAQLASRSESLSQRVRKLGDEKVVVSDRMASVEARYRKQFAALDTLLAQMQSTGNFLSQQLSALNR
jgi:flagellar hook-associated protein 2